MAYIMRDKCRVNNESLCYAEDLKIELWLKHTHDSRYKEVDENTPWLGKIFDPPNPHAIKEGQLYELTLSSGKCAKCKLLKIATYMPGADAHYIPEAAEEKKVWVFLGLEHFDDLEPDPKTMTTVIM